MAPVPVLLFVRIVALVEFHLITMRVLLPPPVVDRLPSPHVIVAIIRIVDASMRLAARREHRNAQRRRKQNRSELPKPRTHAVSFPLPNPPMLLRQTGVVPPNTAAGP